MFDFTDLAFMTGLVMALANVVKDVFGEKVVKFIPIFNLVTGLIAGTLFVSPSDLKTGIVAGIIIGTSSSGLYSGYKNIMEGFSQTKQKIDS